jgi:serine/threonine protein kinase
MDRQTDINENMRAILTDWIVDVHLKFKLEDEVLYLTVHLIDRYLELEVIERKKLQLVGVTAIFIASKYMESALWNDTSDGVGDFADITDNAYTNDEIISLETRMFLAFECHISLPAALWFVRIMHAEGSVHQKTVWLTQYYVESMLQQYSMLGYKPFVIAAAAFTLARKTVGEDDKDAALLAAEGAAAETAEEAAASSAEKARPSFSASLIPPPSLSPTKKMSLAEKEERAAVEKMGLALKEKSVVPKICVTAQNAVAKATAKSCYKTKEKRKGKGKVHASGAGNYHDSKSYTLSNRAFDLENFTLEECSGFTEVDACLKDMIVNLQGKHRPVNLQAVYTKFSRPCFGEVAKLCNFSKGRKEVRNLAAAQQHMPSSSAICNSTHITRLCSIPPAGKAASDASLPSEKSERYEKHSKMLGLGTYGKMYQAWDRELGEIVAVKRYCELGEKKGISWEAIREISLLHELNHPNIIKLKDCFQTESSVLGKTVRPLHAVFEILDRDLRKYLDSISKPLEQQLVKSYLFQMLLGVSFCHARGVMHRDLKPQHLLINNAGALKLGGFGSARAFTLPIRALTHEITTLWYRAPEVLLGSRYYCPAVDMWAVGSIFVEMVNRVPLFSGDSEIGQLYRIFRLLGTPNSDIWPGVCELPEYAVTFPKWATPPAASLLISSCGRGVGGHGLDLLEKLLKYDPAQRISAKRALQHPYFDDLDQSDANAYYRTNEHSDLEERTKREAEESVHRLATTADCNDGAELAPRRVSIVGAAGSGAADTSTAGERQVLPPRNHGGS